ncbi:MAG TPA: energy transducer TonB [Allosphingosinicella sp.]|nr:energy transducer TonB [Allosphingosinicella sp.]
MHAVLLALAASAAQESGAGELDRQGAPGEARPAQYRSGALSSDDYPMAAIRAGAQGAVVVRALVGTSGRIERCEVVASSGHELLDDVTCRLLGRRYRYEPATGPDGRAAPGSVLHRIFWILPSSTPTVDEALEQHLRAARPGRARLRAAPAAFDYPPAALRARAQGTALIRFTISARGIVQSCSIARSSGNEDLDTASCVMAFNHLLYFPAIGADGRATTETRTQSINWRLPDAAPPAQPPPPPGDA